MGVFDYLTTNYWACAGAFSFAGDAFLGFPHANAVKKTPNPLLAAMPREVKELQKEADKHQRDKERKAFKQRESKPR